MKKIMNESVDYANDRKKQIFESNYHEQYKLFLFECENEPFPGTEEWKNGIPYKTWVSEMHMRFKAENNIPFTDDIMWYIEERDMWVSEQLSKYIQ